MDANTLSKDPDFLGLPEPEKIRVLDRIDPDFSGLPQGEKVRVMQTLAGGAGRKWSDVPGEAASNIIPSAGRFAKSIAEPILHPVRTIEGLSRMLRGGLGISPEEKPAWEATKQFFVDRYGSEDALKRTIATDPIGFTADVSTVLAGGGAAAAKAPGMVGKVGAGVQKVGEAINPVTMAAKAVKVPLGAAVDVAGDALTESSFKLGTKLKNRGRDEMISTIQTNKILPNKAGVLKIQSLVDDLKRTGEGLELQASLAGGKRINVGQLLDKSIDPVIAKWARSDEGAKFTGALQRYKRDVLASHPGDISLSEAIALKRRLQEQLKPVFAKQMTINPGYKQSVIDQGKGALEAAVKAELETAIPGYADVNSQIHKLLKVQPFVETASNRIAQYNSLRLTDMLFGLSGWAVTGDPVKAVAVGVAARVLTDPANIARAGNLMSKTVKADLLRKAGGAALGARAGGLLSGPVD
jgi:hypothetical protein